MDILFSSNREMNRALLVFFWIAYAVATAFLISNHVPWRDEAYVWLIGRELSWLDIYREAGAHHSPSLWYYILAVPAKLGLPYWSIQLFHWLGACFAAWVFLFKAPFSTFFKITFVFSFYIAYEHTVTARVYMLTLLLIWNVCWCYAARYQRPILYGVIIALLANVSFLGLLAATFLTMEYLLFRNVSVTRRHWCAMVVMLLAILLSLYGLTLNKYAASYCANLFPIFRPKLIKDIFLSSYLAPNSDYYFSRGIKTILRSIAPWLGVLYGILTLWLLKRWKAYSLMAFLVLSWLSIVCLMVFNYSWPHPRHYSFLLMYTVMVLWIGKVRCQSAKTRIETFLGILFVVSFLLGVFGTVAQGRRDLSLPFSGSKKMADFIIENKLADNVFVSDDIAITVSVLPYLPKVALWDARVLRTVRFLHYDHLPIGAPSAKMTLSLMEENFFFPGEIYLILTKPLAVKWCQALDLMYAAKGQNDSLWLYVVRGSGEEPTTVGRVLAELASPALEAPDFEIHPDEQDILDFIDME